MSRYLLRKTFPGYHGCDINIHDHVLLKAKGKDACSGWWDGSTIHNLPTGFEPVAFNDNNLIVGMIDDHVHLYGNGELTKVGPGKATDINNEGTIVGSISLTGKVVPCCWKNGEVAWNASESGAAVAINNCGDFVFVLTEDIHEYCYSEDESPEAATAFVCQKGTVRQLFGPNGESTPVRVTDISDEGTIIGFYIGPTTAWDDTGDYSHSCMAVEAGYVGLKWHGDSVAIVPDAPYSGGCRPSLIGPDDIILGTYANSSLDMPSSFFATYESAVFWNQKETTKSLESEFQGGAYLHDVCGISQNGTILAELSSSENACLFVVSKSFQKFEQKIDKLKGEGKYIWVDGL